MTQPEAQSTSPSVPLGGTFLLSEIGQTPIFTPEQLSDEQRMFYKTASEFVQKEVLPHADRIEAKDPDFLRELLAKAGELGLLMIEIPEAYGGLGSDVTTALLVSEANARLGAWSVTIGAHTGIGTQPILFFGNDDQKGRYLPALATGEKVAAYALTEPNAGSDALAGRTKAIKGEDGQWVINGNKQWITNGSIADVFVVFAKVDGENFTGFIVEKGYEGFTVGPEEHKMGIRGSSTTTLHFEDCKVPPENQLYEIGRGHKIAFNILNLGRLKLGFGTTGGAKNMLADAVMYASERKTFETPIVEYGILRRKLAKMAALIHASESMAYRTVGLIDQRIGEGGGHDDPAAIQEALEQYAIESSIMKVFGSETLDYVADEDLQIHGGYGYVEDYMIERGYRDSRINRIFEGTNEINRLLVPGMLLKRTMKGQVPVMQAIAGLNESFEKGEVLPDYDGPLGAEKRAAEAVKRMALQVIAMAVGRYGPNLETEQEVLGELADIMAWAFAIDSTVTRSLQHQDDHFELREALTRFYAAEAYEQAHVVARRLLATMLEGEALDEQLARLDMLWRYTPVNMKALQEVIVKAVEQAEGYPLAI